MQVQVVTVIRNKGTGKVSGRAFDFLVVGALMKTARGTEIVELMLDGDAPEPESGKRYDVEIAFYPNKEKKLAFRVEALRPVAVGAVPGAKAA